MDAAAQLDQIAEAMTGILMAFRGGASGLRIAPGDQGRFTSLVLEVRDIADSCLGPGNDYSARIEAERALGIQNYFGSQSFQSIDQARSIVVAAAKALRRRAFSPVNSAALGGSPSYVDLGRLEELRKAATSGLDLRRLVRMCEELNSSFAAANYIASALLLRAILDHVPPILGARTFGEYSASIAGRSVKAVMDKLQSSSRHVADNWLHQQIRATESLPSGTQVDFRQELDVLLSEVLRAAEK
jgi:hypothetical protein